MNTSNQVSLDLDALAHRVHSLACAVRHLTRDYVDDPALCEVHGVEHIEQTATLAEVLCDLTSELSSRVGELEMCRLSAEAPSEEGQR